MSHQAVSELLHVLGYSLQADRKTLEGTSHPDRDAQFRHIDGAVQLQQPPWAWPPASSAAAEAVADVGRRIVREGLRGRVAPPAPHH